MLLLCDQAREVLADTSSRFGQFREVLLAMEGKADAKGLAEEMTLLRAIRARGDRILQTASHNHSLTMAVLRNRLILPEVGIAPEIVKGDEDALRLVKPTGTGSLGGATGQPFTNGGRQARRAQRFASSGKGGQYPQGGARQFAPTLGPRGQASVTPWGQFAYTPGPNTQQAGARNARPGPRQQHASAAAGSAAPPHLLRERQEQHLAEQAAQAARPDAPPGRHICFNCRTAGRPHNHPHKACAWTVCAHCKWVGHTQRECIRDFVPE